MKGIYLTILSLFLMVSVSHAGLVSRYFTYAPTSTVTNTNLNGNFDNIVNTLNGGLTGANTDSANGWRFIEILSSPPAAGNQGRVVFDSSTNTLQFDTGSSFIMTAVLPNNQTFTGNNTFSGNFTANGTTNSIGNGGSDTLALNIPSGLSSSAMTWTLSGALTFSGTIANLGSVTTADINGGTIDGTAIGASSTSTGAFSTLKVGTTNQGDILYDNGTSLVRLTPGTSGQSLKTQGASANPTWAYAPGFSNVIARWGFPDGGSTATTEGAYGIDQDGANLAGEFSLRSHSSKNGAYVTLMSIPWTKISGVNTLTVHARAKASTADGVSIKVTIGALSGSGIVASVTYANLTPFTIDISSLTNGTVYTIAVQAKNNDSGASNIGEQNVIQYTIEGS